MFVEALIDSSLKDNGQDDHTNSKISSSWISTNNNVFAFKSKLSQTLSNNPIVSLETII